MASSSSRIIVLSCILSALLFLYFHKTDTHHPSLPCTVYSLPYESLHARIYRRILHTRYTRNIKIQKSKVPHEEKRDSKYQEGDAEEEYPARESADELIYHTDYHGVATHPNLVPKDPMQKKALRPRKSNAPPSH